MAERYNALSTERDERYPLWHYSFLYLGAQMKLCQYMRLKSERLGIVRVAQFVAHWCPMYWLWFDKRLGEFFTQMFSRVVIIAKTIAVKKNNIIIFMCISRLQ